MGRDQNPCSARAPPSRRRTSAVAVVHYESFVVLAVQLVRHIAFKRMTCVAERYPPQLIVQLTIVVLHKVWEYLDDLSVAGCNRDVCQPSAGLVAQKCATRVSITGNWWLAEATLRLKSEPHPPANRPARLCARPIDPSNTKWRRASARSRPSGFACLALNSTSTRSDANMGISHI